MSKQLDPLVLAANGHFNSERAIAAGRDARTEALRAFFFRLRAWRRLPLPWAATDSI